MPVLILFLCPKLLRLPFVLDVPPPTALGKDTLYIVDALCFRLRICMVQRLASWRFICKSQAVLIGLVVVRHKVRSLLCCGLMSN